MNNVFECDHDRSCSCNGARFAQRCTTFPLHAWLCRLRTQYENSWCLVSANGWLSQFDTSLLTKKFSCTVTILAVDISANNISSFAYPDANFAYNIGTSALSLAPRRQPDRHNIHPIPPCTSAIRQHTKLNLVQRSNTLITWYLITHEYDIYSTLD